MSNPETKTNPHYAESNKNTTRLGLWTLAWLITLAIAAFGPKLIWNFHTALTVLAVLINLAVGARMIFANKQHLQGLDEMHQKIFLDAAALTLGVGLVCGVSYELFEDIKLIQFEPSISHLVVLMSLTFLAAMIGGHRKYR
jgi:hypothetical protein